MVKCPAWITHSDWRRNTASTHVHTYTHLHRKHRWPRPVGCFIHNLPSPAVIIIIISFVWGYIVYERAKRDGQRFCRMWMPKFDQLPKAHKCTRSCPPRAPPTHTQSSPGNTFMQMTHVLLSSSMPRSRIWACKQLQKQQQKNKTDPFVTDSSSSPLICRSLLFRSALVHLEALQVSLPLIRHLFESPYLRLQRVISFPKMSNKRERIAVTELNRQIYIEPQVCTTDMRDHQEGSVNMAGIKFYHTATTAPGIVFISEQPLTSSSVRMSGAQKTLNYCHLPW